MSKTSCASANGFMDITGTATSAGAAAGGGPSRGVHAHRSLNLRKIKNKNLHIKYPAKLIKLTVPKMQGGDLSGVDSGSSRVLTRSALAGRVSSAGSSGQRLVWHNKGGSQPRAEG